MGLGQNHLEVKWGSPLKESSKRFYISTGYFYTGITNVEGGETISHILGPKKSVIRGGKKGALSLFSSFLWGRNKFLNRW